MNPSFKEPPERHTRKCSICHHPEREEIEEAYLNWVSPDLIVVQHSLPSCSSLYRHAEATGLPILRRRQLRSALDHLIEHAGRAKVTGGDVIRAIITSSRIGEDGEYTEPPKRTEIVHLYPHGKPNSNRETNILETSQPQQNKDQVSV